MITHYIPQWLLRRFGAPLYEVDIYTGHVSPRTIRKAASSNDLWPAEIEEDLMGTHDNDAACVFRYWIRGNRRIVLPDPARKTLALWLALFGPRVPSTAISIERRLEATRDDPREAIALMYKSRGKYLELIRRKDPQIYRQTVDALGTFAGEEWLLAGMARRLRSGEIKWLPNPDQVYHLHLKTARIDDFADVLLQYHWTWLYSPRGFVIGDNPLLRWHELSQGWNYGIKRANVQITMPLSHNLCLRMDRKKRNDNGQVMNCPGE